jgi:hypothetical protein
MVSEWQTLPVPWYAQTTHTILNNAKDCEVQAMTMLRHSGVKLHEEGVIDTMKIMSLWCHKQIEIVFLFISQIYRIFNMRFPLVWVSFPLTWSQLNLNYINSYKNWVLALSWFTVIGHLWSLLLTYNEGPLYIMKDVSLIWTSVWLTLSTLIHSIF